MEEGEGEWWGMGRGGGWAGSSVFSTGLSAAVVAFEGLRGKM
jgi:hypothetical protein